MKTDETTSKLVSSRPYQGFSLHQAASRVGSLKIFENPSRFGNNLRYPDGREVLLRVREVQEDDQHADGQTGKGLPSDLY